MKELFFMTMHSPSARLSLYSVEEGIAVTGTYVMRRQSVLRAWACGSLDDDDPISGDIFLNRMRHSAIGFRESIRWVKARGCGL